MGYIDQFYRRILSKRILLAGLSALLILFAVIITRRAWLGDDAYITFRTVDNFINGYGLTWNVDERVQAYTHPLWMLLLSLVYFFTHEIYYSSIILSLLISIITVWILAFKVSRSPLSAIFAVLILTLCNAFVDYTTSGLENPFSHLLLIIFLAVYFHGKTDEKNLLTLSFIASLGLINRMDTALIFLPVLLYRACEVRTWKGIGMLVMGQIPFICWEIFSILYYGFPFPNTSYAKLNTGISTLAYITQSKYYFLSIVEKDPLVLVTIFYGLSVPFINRSHRDKPIALGIFLYLLYIVMIGSDFMAGRFFSLSLLAAVCILARLDLEAFQWYQSGLLFIIVLILGLSIPLPTYKVLSLKIQRDPYAGVVDAYGIADERQTYYMFTGLMRAPKVESMPDHYLRTWGTDASLSDKKVVEQINVGIFGYYAGPKVHIIDRYALADPLLAHLPALYNESWRIGHFERAIPEGYTETLLDGKNRLNDPDLAQYYDKLNLIIRGDIFDKQRLAAIWHMNKGDYDHLIDTDKYRLYYMDNARLEDVRTLKPHGMASNDPGNTHLSINGIEVRLKKVSHAHLVETTLDINDDYRLVYLLNGTQINTQVIPGDYNKSGLEYHLISVPDDVTRKGFDSIRILPISGDNAYYMGHIAVK